MTNKKFQVVFKNQEGDYQDGFIYSDEMPFDQSADLYVHDLSGHMHQVQGSSVELVQLRK